MQFRRPALFSLLLVVSAGCGCSPASGGGYMMESGDAAGDAALDAAPVDIRGRRYCEILLGTIQGENVHIDVYSTEGLNECPDAAWALEDTGALTSATVSDVALLNGPRYWMLNSLAGSTLQDATVRTLGGIDMRKAGAIDLPAASVAAMSKPYLQHTIHRNSAFHWNAGQTVFELIDGAGHVYDMQSFSAQKKPLTEAALVTLGTQLTLPVGWSFHTRTLTADLVLTATDGNATVVQDDLGNTYSLAQ